MPSPPHGIVRYFLYGEPERPAAERFIHLEAIESRSRPANWVIAAHAHADLHQVFSLEAGGGEADGDGARLTLVAPCLAVAPAGVVHAFRFQPETTGHVLTFADAFWRALAAREPAIAGLLDQGLWTAPGAANADIMAALERELSAPPRTGRGAALEALATLILVEAARASGPAAGAPPGLQAQLVTRFRAWLEVHHAAHPTVEAAAAALGVTPLQLRAACASIAGAAPAQMLRDRLNLEAKRLLRYSDLTVTQVAVALGFEDPAYFSRFFSRANGQSPRHYRRIALSDNEGDGASA